MTQTEIDQAIKDQIGTNPEEPLPSNPDITQALANYATEAARVAGVLNNNLQSNYLTGFQNWSQLVMAGKIPNTDPPHPPTGYIAAKVSDGWTYVIHGGDPVMAMPPVPQVPPPGPAGVVAIGSRIASTNFWSAFTPACDAAIAQNPPPAAASINRRVGTAERAMRREFPEVAAGHGACQLYNAGPDDGTGWRGGFLHQGHIAVRRLVGKGLI